MPRIALLLVLLVAAGCDCGGGVTKTLEADLEIGPDLQFGTVRVGQKKTLAVQLTNTGSALVHIESFAVSAPFSIDAVAPLELDRAEAREILVTYEPTEPNADDLESHVGQLVVVNSSERSPRLELNLAGHATRPRFVVEPSSLDFGDRDAGTRTDLALTIENLGNERVQVLGVTLDSAVFTGNSEVFRTVFTQGTRVTAHFTYAPTTGGPDEATLVLQTDSPSMPELRIPFSGRSLVAQVQLCYGFPGEPEQCLPSKGPDGKELTVGELRFGALDEGTSRVATLTLRNQGNVAVPLVALAGTGMMTKDVTANRQLCGLPPPRQADFAFAPESFGQELPVEGVVEMKVTYSPDSNCIDDLNDSGLVMFRAGGTGAPTYRLDLRGSSRFGQVQVDNVFWEVDRPEHRMYAVKNVGFGPLHVNRVVLVEGDEGVEGNRNTNCARDCALRAPCAGSSHPECQPFRWVAEPAEGDINPAILDASGEVVAGMITFGPLEYVPPKRCATPGQTDCLALPQVFRTCVRIESDDPYRASTCGTLSGTAL